MTFFTNETDEHLLKEIPFYRCNLSCYYNEFQESRGWLYAANEDFVNCQLYSGGIYFYKSGFMFFII